MSRTFGLIVMLALLQSVPAGAVPIGPTDIVTIGSREWAQVDLFLGLSWDDIDNVCPAGVCSSNTLNGYDMAGWTWASADDLNPVLNTHLAAGGFSGSDLLGPGPDSVFPNPGFDNPAATLFFSDGWRPTAIDLPEQILTAGWLSDFGTATSGGTVGFQGVVRDRFIDVPFGFDQFATNLTWASDRASPFEGGWFYRDLAQVPLPSTALLSVLGVLLLACRGKTRLAARRSFRI